MVVEKILNLTKGWETPKYPLLGPNLKALYLFGLWDSGSKLRKKLFLIVHLITLNFTHFQLLDLYIVRNDINKVVNNVSLTVLSIICYAKCCSYLLHKKRWRRLVQGISEEEIFQIKKNDPKILKCIDDYTKYTRVITVLFWCLVFVTNSLLIVTPLLKYLSSKKLRQQISAGEELLPQIIYAWFPFVIDQMPGYAVGIFIQIAVASQGSGVIAGYDMHAIAIMSYFKGQLIILRQQCKDIFEGAVTDDDILDKIKEFHRHHTVLLKQYKLFNSLLLPTMFIYVLMCSLTICGSVVQLHMENITNSQKMFIFQYTLGLILQLFMYCWHGTEVTVQSYKLTEGIYNSNWWQGNPFVRKQLLLLAGKFNFLFKLSAGPYSSLCVPVFVDIIKGSYSFYTLFTQMQEDK